MQVPSPTVPLTLPPPQQLNSPHQRPSLSDVVPQQLRAPVDPQLEDARAALAEAQASNSEMRVQGAQAVLDGVERALSIDTQSAEKEAMALELRQQVHKAGGTYTTGLSSHLPPVYTNWARPTSTEARSHDGLPKPIDEYSNMKELQQDLNFISDLKQAALLTVDAPTATRRQPEVSEASAVTSVPDANPAPRRRVGITWGIGNDAGAAAESTQAPQALVKVETEAATPSAANIGGFSVAKFIATYSEPETTNEQLQEQLQEDAQSQEPHPAAEPPQQDQNDEDTNLSEAVDSSWAPMPDQATGHSHPIAQPRLQSLESDSSLLSSNGMLTRAKEANTQAFIELDQVMENLQLRIPDSNTASNFTCRHCGVWPITDILFRCVQCVGFELCQQCEEDGRHSPSHPLLQLRLPGAHTERPSEGGSVTSSGCSSPESGVASSLDEQTSQSFSVVQGSATPSEAPTDDTEDDDEDFFWGDGGGTLNSELTEESWQVNSAANTTASNSNWHVNSGATTSNWPGNSGTSTGAFGGNTSTLNESPAASSNDAAYTPCELRSDPQQPQPIRLRTKSELLRNVGGIIAARQESRGARGHSAADSELSSSEGEAEPWETTLSGVQWWQRKVVGDSWVQWREVAAEKRWLGDAVLAAVSHMASLAESCAWFHWKSRVKRMLQRTGSHTQNQAAPSTPPAEDPLIQVAIEWVYLSVWSL